MATAVFPGSFDPLTNGHVDIALRALKIFDKVILAVLSNPDKSTLFSLGERLQLTRQEFADSPRLEIKSFSGLLVEFAKQENASVVIRGLRAVSDYEYEAQMALMNKKLSDEVETLFMMTRESNSYISSSLVKQVAALGGDISKLVPANIARALNEKLGKKVK